jgi:glycosyltransferase involved in cell wall biosynthesis
MLGQLADVTILTRANNEESIVRALPEVPEARRMHFEYVDLPRWMRFWKRGPSGAHLYYILWQVAAVRRARRLVRVEPPPDLVWHLTWANAWLGSLAPLLPYPFVYGPVGGGTHTPWRLAGALGVRGFLSEVFRTLARATSRSLNPVARLAWRRARLILVQNPETREWLPARHRGKAVVFPNVVLDEDLVPSPIPTKEESGNHLLYVGRLLPLKGVSLAIRALPLLPGWKLIICGDGPDRRRLQRQARRSGVTERVRFLGRLAREDARRLMKESADVLILPSYHDEGGFVVVEALAAGTPVVCLDRGGPPVLGGKAVTTSSVSSTITGLARAVLEVAGDRPTPYPSMPAHVEMIRSLIGPWDVVRASPEARTVAPESQETT